MYGLVVLLKLPFESMKLPLPLTTPLNTKVPAGVVVIVSAATLVVSAPVIETGPLKLSEVPLAMVVVSARAWVVVNDPVSVRL